MDNISYTAFLIWYPLLSTVILLTLIPFVSNGAYWLSLKFEKWRVDNKNEIEKKQLLTLEQSIQLRGQIIESERKFDSLLQSLRAYIIATFQNSNNCLERQTLAQES